MPGWFSAFIAIVIVILALLALVCVWKHSQRSRAGKLAQTYIESEKSYQPSPDEDKEKARLKRLQKGMIVWKHAFGSNQRRLKKVALLGSDSLLVSKGDIKSRAGLSRALEGSEVGLELRKVLAVQLGPLSRAHRRHLTNIARQELCFSILTTERSLDLEALTEVDLEDWMFWLQSRFPKHQHWAGLPLYNEMSLHCALENMKTGSMPPMAFSFDRTFEGRLREDEMQLKELLEQDRLERSHTADRPSPGPEKAPPQSLPQQGHLAYGGGTPVYRGAMRTPAPLGTTETGTQPDQVALRDVHTTNNHTLIPQSPQQHSPFRAAPSTAYSPVGVSHSPQQHTVVDIDCSHLR